ncbi:hypothetical protein HRD49_34810 [Corallococcus exiguus]|uniref:hypothetical protein n=1 Tax=Corallococcus exiguus TaxID=83462 RepID=UPI00155FDBE4|nr:hypothetical protein [Corallococcus exiguus]NRD66930.1 hypothetical protein [Corallococcus exiguus]
MTKQKDLKALIRERMAKTGEKYAAARLHVLGSGDGPGGDDPRCPACKGRLRAVQTRIEPDSEDFFDDMTDGQIADYHFAEETGDYSNWTIEALYCPRCEPEPPGVLDE